MVSNFVFLKIVRQNGMRMGGGRVDVVIIDKPHEAEADLQTAALLHCN